MQSTKDTKNTKGRAGMRRARARGSVAPPFIRTGLWLIRSVAISVGFLLLPKRQHGILGGASRPAL